MTADPVHNRGPGIHIADKEGIILFSDLAFDSLFGYEQGAITGKHVSILNAGSDKENSRKIKEIFKSLKNAGVWNGNFFNRKKNGDPISTQSRILPIQYNKQQCWLAVVEDMDGRERAGESFQLGTSLARLITNVSARLARLEPRETEKGILHALQMLGEFIQAGHAYICQLARKGDRIDWVSEWCAPGIEAQIPLLKEGAAANLPWQQSKPSLLIPLCYGKSSVGFLGFDGFRGTKTWSEESVLLLRTAGEILIGAWERKRLEGELQKTEEKYRNLVENINDVIFSLDRQGRFTFISPVVEQLIAYKPEELMGQPLARFVYGEDLTGFAENLKRNLEHAIESFEFRILDRKGNVRFLRVSSRPLITNGEATGLTGILSDVTAHKWAEDWLRKTQERYRSLFENALEGIFQSTLEGQFIIANPACARILGYSSPADLTAQDSKPTGLLFAEQEKYQEFKRLLAEHGIVQNFETQVFRRDQSKIWISLNALAIRSPSGAPLFYEGRIEDITERKWSEDRIYHLSFHDKLTGLYNRAYFEEELKRLDTERQLPISLIFGDVNCLKLINDAFGHPEGDKLLIQIAVILRESCRKEEVIARVGGDEFAIFLPKTSGGTTEEIVRRIRLSCTQKSSGPLQLSIALGRGTKERPSQDIKGILRDAEERMYKSKLLEGKGMRNSFIASFRRNLFEKSYETEDHSRRIQHLALQMGRTLGLSDEELNRLTLLAAWHDIGYIALPEEILKKQGRLSEEEWKWIRRHPEIGYRIAESSPELASIGEAILAHHERWDGTGYPLGLKAETIPLISRIISIVDAYDVMNNGRPYRPAMTQQICLGELQNNAGTQFDSKLIDILLKVIPTQD